MAAPELLRDPEVASSVAWEACRRLFGEIDDWEPDAFRLSLQSHDVEATPGLMAKILGAQTIATTGCWLHDHDVLFAFALACYGVPAAADAFHHPEPRQLCWMMQEIQAIRGAVPDEHEGFDPDEVDPAIACVLAEDGWFHAPDELTFAQWCLDRMTFTATADREATTRQWQELRVLQVAELRGKLQEKDHDVVATQLDRLVDARVHVLEMEDLRARQRTSLPF